MTNNSNTPTYPYLDYFEATNAHLKGMQNFRFYPGMLFGSSGKWWPDTGMRPTKHEGIDICYYTDSSGRKKQLSCECNIPVMTGGTIFRMCHDFLGQSVFLDHNLAGRSRLLSVYAHLVLKSSLHPGKRLQPGEVIGNIADTAGRKNRMVAHVHLSFLQIPHEISAEMLSWDFICSSSQVSLLDPLEMISHGKIKMYKQNRWREEELAKL